MNNGSGQFATPRVHAIVLTRDRPEGLRRCVETTLSRLGRDDALTILDDSAQTKASEHHTALVSIAKRSRTVVSHLPAEQAHRQIAVVNNGSRMFWQAKSAVRDIAPLRNLSLLLSATLGARTTILIDDDVTGFDLVATHRFLAERLREPSGVVAGAQMGGWTEMDTVSQLQEALTRLTASPERKHVSLADLFRAAIDNRGQRANECQWVSAGYMAFSIPTVKLMAFPPGYNEDWLWCLLQHSDRGTRIVKTRQLVLHEPSMLRRLTCDNARFELEGDLILDSLTECLASGSRKRVPTLRRLSEYTPDTSILPATRVAETMQQAAEVERLGLMQPQLREYGLGVIEEMSLDDSLKVNGRAVVHEWCVNAEAKQRAFTPMLDNAAVTRVLRALWTKGMCNGK